MNYILSAILSNLSFAISDNLTGLVAKKNKPLQISFWSSLFSIAIFFIPAITIFSGEFAKLTPHNILVMVALAIIINLGFLSFTTSMNRGSITLSGVIACSFPALTTVLSVLIFGETITFWQTIAVVFVVVGVAMSSMSGRLKTMLNDIKSSGTIFAIITLLLWGTYFAFIRVPIEQVGWFMPNYVDSIVGAVLFLTIGLLATNKKASLKRPKLSLVLLVAAGLGFCGSMFFNYAISKGDTAIVAPIAGSSPAVFVVIAYFIFHEKLNKKQWAGIFLTLVGIVGLSIFSS